MAKTKFNGGIEMMEIGQDAQEYPDAGRTLLLSNDGDFIVSRTDNSSGRVLTSDRQEVATGTSLGSVIIGGGLDVDGNGIVSVEQVGHTIEDQTGTSLPQRGNLRFAGTGFTSVSDSEAENATIVTVNNPMTGQGDMIVGGEDGVPEAIAPGGVGQILTMSTNGPSWQVAPLNNPMTELGQLIVGDENGTPVALDKGTGHQVLGHLIPDPEDPDDPNRLEVGWVDAVMPNPAENSNVYMTDLAFGENGSDVLVLKKSTCNVVNYTTATAEIALPLADSDQNGFMAKEDVASLASHETRISALEGKSSRYAVTIPNSPTQEELTELYEDASGESGDPATDGVRLVDVAKNIVYTWFSSDSTWHGPESDTVSVFTNTSAGIIKGSSGTAGKVYAESDGTGSVYGWDTMTSTVSGKQDALSFATTSAISNTSNALDVKVDGTTITKNASTGTLSANEQPYTLPVATTSALGGIKPDGTTITVNASTGVATAVGGGGDITGWLPSTEYIAITPGSSEATYTAPCNGWICISGKSSTSNGTVMIENNYDIDTGTTLGYTASSISYSSLKVVNLICPVSQGDIFKFTYSSYTFNGFGIFKLKGEV
jgi:hypothetical protein